MSEQNMLADLRTAKVWVDAQFATFADISARLRETETQYNARSGQYASIPKERARSVQSQIDDATKEPGSELLGDTRPGRTS